jgi:hypothetical protein
LSSIRSHSNDSNQFPYMLAFDRMTAGSRTKSRGEKGNTG